MLQPRCLRAAGYAKKSNPSTTPDGNFGAFKQSLLRQKVQPCQAVPAGGPEWGMNVIAGKPLSGLHLDSTNIPRIGILNILNYGGMPREISLMRAAKARKT
jgi:hypothetical protein